MSWARIDDAFDDHPKVLALLEMEDAAAAIGLWTLCLTYAHRNTRKKDKTPGLIPSSLPRRFFGPAGKNMAALLVEVGLWDEVEDGWLIHDFAEYLPTKEVSAARSAAGKKGAAKRWGGKPDEPDGKTVAGPKQDDGNLPSEHGSEPSEDGNAIASDGSRAGAHRERVDVGTTGLFPVPDPDPGQPSAAEPSARRERDPIDDIAGLTLTQRSKRITNAYAEAEPMCNWPAINGIVLKALKSNKYADSEIRDGLLRLAGEGRAVTVETLRTELQGMPPRERGAPSGGSRNAQILSAAMERAVRAEQQRVNATIPRGEIPA